MPASAGEEGATGNPLRFSYLCNLCNFSPKHFGAVVHSPSPVFRFVNGAIRENVVRTRGKALGYRSCRKSRIFSRISQRRSKSKGEVSALARIRISTESDLKSV